MRIIISLRNKRSGSGNVIQNTFPFFLRSNICHRTRNASHSAAGKRIINDVSGVCIVKNILHNGLLRNFRMISVHIVEIAAFPFAHIRRERFAVIIVCCLVIRFPVLPDKVRKKRIRASRIPRRVRQGDNVFVRPNGESLDPPDLVNVFLRQFARLHGLTFHHLLRLFSAMKGPVTYLSIDR